MKVKLNELAEFYSVSTDSFTVGRCIKSDNKSYLLETVDSQGKWNGYYWFHESMIQEISYDTDYLKKISVYEDFWKKHNPLKPSLKRDDFSSLDPSVILDLAEKKKLFVTVFTKEDMEYNVGYVSKNGKKYKLKCVRLENGGDLGDFTFKANEVIFVEVDSPDNRLLQYAYENLN
jgi:hypothetical protein